MIDRESVIPDDEIIKEYCKVIHPWTGNNNDALRSLQRLAAEFETTIVDLPNVIGDFDIFTG